MSWAWACFACSAAWSWSRKATIALAMSPSSSPRSVPVTWAARSPVPSWRIVAGKRDDRQHNAAADGNDQRDAGSKAGGEGERQQQDGPAADARGSVRRFLGMDLDRVRRVGHRLFENVELIEKGRQVGAGCLRIGGDLRHDLARGVRIGVHRREQLGRDRGDLRRALICAICGDMLLERVEMLGKVLLDIFALQAAARNLGLECREHVGADRVVHHVGFHMVAEQPGGGGLRVQRAALLPRGPDAGGAAERDEPEHDRGGGIGGLVERSHSVATHGHRAPQERYLRDRWDMQLIIAPKITGLSARAYNWAGDQHWKGARMRVPPAKISAALLACALGAPAAHAQDGVDLSAAYVMDVVAVGAEARPARIYWLDNLDLTADLELEKLAGWNGATAHVDVLVNMGGMPNDRAGTLQGVDNIEVASHRLRLFEAWIEQKLGERTTVRAGLYDLNSEFYSTDASGLLIAPAFGVGSEIAATGPNGPSIFPSTALAVRIDYKFGGDGFVRAAMLNATARTLGDPGGVNLTFDDGALLIAEGGVAGTGGKLAVGAWGYTRRQDDVFALDAAGAPLQRHARGAYVVAEKPLNDPEGRHPVAGFVRVGVSDGQTTPFKGGWQAGVLVTKLWQGRDDSQISFGVNQAWLSNGYRDVLRGEGPTAGRPRARSS
jgi:porin